ncbi:MAG: hypothetical protein SVY53_04165, partial [Chloroflexota bacterium]|nr:hypothetical protein [Chloroflexota bacterium]
MHDLLLLRLFPPEPPTYPSTADGWPGQEPSELGWHGLSRRLASVHCSRTLDMFYITLSAHFPSDLHPSTYPPTSGNTGKPLALPVAPFNTMSQLSHCYEINLTTGEETSHYYLGGREIAYRNNNGLKYVHQDHLSGTSLTTDSSGALVANIDYFPFGVTRTESGLLDTDKLFTGQRLDG